MGPRMDKEAILRHIETTRAELWKDEGDQKWAKNAHGSVTSAISILSAVYGPSSHQVERFIERAKFKASDDDRSESWYRKRLARELEETLDSVKRDIEAGIFQQVASQAKGEVLGDFIALAREALASSSVSSDRVAAVLAAAALEETLKQLGERAGIDVLGRDMRGVIQKLKDGGVLSGAEAPLASGYSKFRDNAFHGEFDEIGRPSTESALAFVEGLLRGLS